MKTCPQCQTQYEETMFFCLEDGTPLKSSEDVTAANPVTLEKTLDLPAGEKTVALPVTEEKTYYLPNNSGETVASPTVQNPAPTAAWKPNVSPTQDIPITKNEDKNYDLNMM